MTMKLTKIIQRFFLFISAIFLTLTVSINHINAQITPFYWEFINVDIAVQNNGDMLVTETQKYVFTRKHTNQRYRYIPLDKVKEINNVSVSKNNEIIPSDTGIENNQLWISWKHPLNPPESHTFVIRYRVVGGLHESGNNLQVYWKAIFPERNSVIKKSQVTVTFPEELAGKILEYESFGVPREYTEIDDKTIQFTAKEELPPQTKLEVKITFPKGILNVYDVYSRGSSSLNATPRNTSKNNTIWGAVMIMYIPAILLGNFLRKRLDSTPRSSSELPSLYDYEIAYLAGRKERLIDLVIINLMHSGSLTFDSTRGKFIKSNIQNENNQIPYLTEIFNSDIHNRFRSQIHGLKINIKQLKSSLQDRELILTQQQSRKLRLISTVPIILVAVAMLFLIILLGDIPPIIIVLLNLVIIHFYFHQSRLDSIEDEVNIFVQMKLLVESFVRFLLQAFSIFIYLLIFSFVISSILLFALSQLSWNSVLYFSYLNFILLLTPYLLLLLIIITNSFESSLHRSQYGDYVLKRLQKENPRTANSSNIFLSFALFGIRAIPVGITYTALTSSSPPYRRSRRSRRSCSNQSIFSRGG